MTDPQQSPRPESGHTGGFREFVSHSAGAVLLVCGLFFLLSFMYLGGTADPQANARHIPVVVVDEDRGAQLETPVGTRGLAVGSQIVGGLLKNNDWERIRLHVVGPEAAEEGLRDGSYFGRIQIPADLSERVAGLIGAAATEAGEGAEPAAPPTISVEYSPRVSIVSSQVMHTIADVMQESLRDRMGTTVLENSQLLAEAEGRSIDSAAAMALADPVRIDVSEWNALPEGVSNASLPMFYALVVILAGFTGAMVISALLDARLGFIPLEIGPIALHVHVAPFGRLQTLVRKWVVTAVTAPLVSGMTLWVAHVLGVTGFDPWHLFWFANLVIISVGVCAHTVIAVIGNAGLLVNLVIFVVLGIPTSGGATPTQMLPQIFVWIGSIQPMHQAYLGLRSIMFFDSSWNADLGRAVWVLTAWLAAGVVLGIVVMLAYERMGLPRQAVAERVPVGSPPPGLRSGRAVGVADPSPTGLGESGEVVERDAPHGQ